VKVLFVSRERHRLPLDDVQRRKWDAIAAEVELRVLAAAAAPGSPTRDERFRLAARLPVLDGPAFYAALPFRVARELREWEPDAVLVQGVHETVLVLLAGRLAGSSAKVVLDLHGDWRTATRLYGSPLRRLLTPLADAFGPVALRRADAVRALSDMTRGLTLRYRRREPDAIFPAYVDLDAFGGEPKPLPQEPRALFVGVLERYKGFDTLLEAWPLVRQGTLHVVGTGTLRVPELPRLQWTPHLTAPEVAAAMDAATVLVLPSRSEGLPRVALEALQRGRPVIGGRAGGIPDIVADGVNGLLVDPGDARALADAINRIFDDRDLAERLAAGARETAAKWRATPEEYARRLGDLLRGAVN
jgi:glycosyltransferase involved in cell wall biosynthesis